MSRKFRKVVASTLALAMMAGTAASMPAGQFATITNVSAAEQAVSTANAANGLKGPKVDAGSYEVKAGETFNIKVKVTDNTEGINGINTWLDIDTDVFEIIADKKGKPTKGDADAEKASYADDLSVNYFSKDNAPANIKTALSLFSGSSNITGDMVLSTITLKVKDDAKDGYYSLPFDAVADGGDMANRLDSSRNPVVLNPTYYGALVKVGNPSADSQPSSPTSTAPSSTPSSTPDQGGQTTGLTAKVADATASAGSTVKTTLTISGAGFAGFTAELGFDSSALELANASASGWDLKFNDGKLVATADQDSSSVTVNLEFKVKTTTAGSYDVKVNSVEAAPKNGSTEYKGTGTKGTITVSGSDSSNPTTTPSTVPSATPTSGANTNANAIRIVAKDTEAKAGGTAKLMIYAENVGKGFSTVQFDYDMDKSFKIESAKTAGDIDGGWKIGTEARALQFLEADGMNVEEEGPICELEISIPEGTADGEYKFVMSNFEGSSFNGAKQDTLKGDAFSGVSAVIKVTGGSSTPATTTPSSTPSTTTPSSKPSDTNTGDNTNADAIQIIVGDATAKAGGTAKVTISAKNVGKGFSTVQFDYDMDKSFKIESAKTAGDIDGGWKIGTEASALQFLEADGMNVDEDGPICELEISIPEGTADGEYKFSISGFAGSTFNGAKQETLSNSDFKGVAGTITVTGGGAAVTPTPSTPPSQVTAIATPGNQNSSGAEQPVTEGNVPNALKGPKVDAGKYVVKAGETFKIKVKVTDNEEGINGINTWLDIDTDIFEIIADKKGKPGKGDTDADKAPYADDLSVNYFHKDNAADNITTALALFSGSANVTGDMVLSTITLKVKDDVKDGFYQLPFDAVADGGDMANRLDSNKDPIVLNPTYYGALVQVGEGDPNTPSTPPTQATPSTPPTSSNGEGIVIKVVGPEEEVAPGSKAKVMLYAENVGTGFSTVQFDYDMDKNFTILSAKTAGDIDGGWKIGTEARALQFLEADGMNVDTDGPICELEIDIPAGTKGGEYPIKLSGFAGSTFTGSKQLTLDDSAFSSVDGVIKVKGDGSSTDKNDDAIIIDVTGPSAAVKPGDTVKVMISAKNAAAGFSTVQFDYDMDKSFTIESAKTAGDIDGGWKIGEEARALQFLEADGMNVDTDGDICELTIKIPEGTADGEYTIKLSNFAGSRFTGSKQVTLGNSDFAAGAVGKIVVKGDGSSAEFNYDVNGDGVVNTADVTDLKKFLLLVEGATVKNGDVNADGKINAMDLVELVRYILSK